VLGTGDARALVHELIGEMVDAGIRRQLEDSAVFDPDHGDLVEWVRDVFAVSLNPDELKNAGGEAIAARTVERVRAAHDQRVAGLPAELVEEEIRRAVLFAIDSRWQEHLADMDELREGVHLRAQGQKDPLIEYKNEAFGLFHALMDSIKQQALVNLRIMTPVPG
jgi:preprotein translocase subunit SecA